LTYGSDSPGKRSDAEVLAFAVGGEDGVVGAVEVAGLDGGVGVGVLGVVVRIVRGRPVEAARRVVDLNRCK
jgi:hypothetical protein